MASPQLVTHALVDHAEELTQLVRSAESARKHGRHSTAETKYRKALGAIQHIRYHLVSTGYVKP